AMDTLSFATLPTDILLLVLRHLRVADVLALRQTCKALDGLTRSRSVWHDALHTHILAPGLPLPGLRSRPLSALSAAELEQLTLRALALRHNWTSASPRTTRSAELDPPGLPAGARARNLAVHYLPGRESRYVLTITFYDEPAAPRKYVVHCWDIGEDTGQPRVVATLRCMNLTGATVNADPEHPGILAITRRGPSDAVTTCIFSIDFCARDAQTAFVLLQEFPSLRFPLALEGSVFAASAPDNVVRVFDIEAGCVRAVLRVPREHDDPTLRNEEQRCLGAVLLPRHILTFCRQWIHLYALPPVPEPSPAVSDAAQHAPAAVCDPLASHKWQWRIDSLVVAPRLRPPAEEGRRDTFPPIDVLVRFDTWFPWPVNILHHYVLSPNPACALLPPSSSPSSSAFPASSPPVPPGPSTDPGAGAAPYLHAGGGPAMAHSIPSPIRLFTPSDMVLGRRGTALWLDAQAYGGGPAQAGDHGQRIAGRVLALRTETGSPPPETSGEGAQGEGEGADRVSPGWYGEGGAQTMVFHMQEEDDGWNKLALDEDEGRIAVGTVYGTVHLFEYAPEVCVRGA
ncbi:hypothetical protein DAEQUDRAFT_669883, partial [Daedalea quercina L-15889]